MKSQMGQAHTHTTHGGAPRTAEVHSLSGQRPPPCYVHSHCGRPPRAAVSRCASEQGPSTQQAPRQDGRGLPPDAGPAVLSPLEEPRGKTGPVCRGGPKRRPGGAWSTAALQ